MVLSVNCLDIYLISHKIGYPLIGFEHVFDTDIDTIDTVRQMECWISPQPKTADRAEDTTVAGREICSKIRNDIGDEAGEAETVEFSEHSSDSDNGDGSSELDGYSDNDAHEDMDNSPGVAHSPE